MKLLLFFFAAFVLYSLIANRWYPIERWYRYVGLYLYVGLPGAGKTYALIYHTVRSMASKREVRTNFHIRPDRIVLALQLCYGLKYQDAVDRLKLHQYIRSFEDLVSCVDCDVYLDEVQDMLKSTDWDIMPHEVITWFAQHRHHRCRIKMTTHKLGAVHNYVRNLVSNIYLAGQPNFFIRALRGVTGMGKKPLLAYSMVKDMSDDLVDNPKRKKGKAAFMRFITSASYMTLDPRIANCYDTHGGVLPSPMDIIRAETNKGVRRYELPARKFSSNEGRALDGLPSLTLQELCNMKLAGEDTSALLRERFDVFNKLQSTYDVPESVSEHDREPLGEERSLIDTNEQRDNWTGTSSTW